jgi:hypothetical protein
MTIDGILEKEFGGEHLFSQLTNGQFSTRGLIVSLLETV